MKSVVLAAALVALAAPAAFAQTAAKHAAADTASGSHAGVPDAVKSYVKSQTGAPYPYTGNVQVGEAVRDVDAQNAWRTVPDYPQYSWGNLNGQLVVADNTTKKVVAVF